jgi:Predicted xylanase/chitin deacetylase
MRKPGILLFLFVTIYQTFYGQTSTSWNGKSSAVVLTYDDGLNIDLSNVIPALDSVGIKGTFYISDYFNGLQKQIPKWKNAAAEGHELANHTIFHPCSGSLPGRSFVTADYDLEHYSMRRIRDEINEMNTILFAIDGKTERTFAYPCGDRKIHDSAYIDPLTTNFIAARGVAGKFESIDKIDLFNIGCFTMNGQTGEQMIALVNQAMQSHALLVFLFHGVGGEHSLNVSIQAHHELLQFLKEHQKEIWIAPMIDVAKFIKRQKY